MTGDVDGPERGSVSGFRDELSRKDHDVVDASWAGAVPRSYGAVREPM